MPLFFFLSVSYLKQEQFKVKQNRIVIISLRLTCMEPAAQFNAAFVRLRNIIGLMSSNFVTWKKRQIV